MLPTASTSPRPSIGPNRRISNLSKRETEVALLMIEGEPIKVIAHRLGVSQHTARRHVEHIYSKLGVHSRTMAVLRILERVAARDVPSLDSAA